MSTRFSRLSPAVFAAATLVVLGSLTAGPAGAAAPPTITSPASSTLGQTLAHHGYKSVTVKGSLQVQLDPSTLQAVPVAGGTKCQFSVGVTLNLAGTVQGTAKGTTVAIINAPCADALSTPPGTFSDVFRFSGNFQGSVSGVPTTAKVEYAGVTRAGGAVSASLVLLGNRATVLAAVQASAGVEGTYYGVGLIG